MSLRFQWDPQKAASNANKHSVTFAEAATAFQDPLALIFDDDDHSIDELRDPRRSFDPKPAARRVLHGT